MTTHLARYRERVDAALEQALPGAATRPARLHAAMRYAVLGGGKRIRPALCYAAAEALQVPLAAVDPAAMALELIHAYSLVHDDLPAMDDDDLRRGQPTCHRAFDEATAILAGDALQALALELLAAPQPHFPAEAQLRMVQLLTCACGSQGMAGGQALDLAAEGTPPEHMPLTALETVHRLKTGALIQASVRLPAELAGAAARQHLGDFGELLGLAFQIQDDILDVAGDTAVLGKRAGMDLAHRKATYPAVCGLAAAEARVAALHEQALAALTPFGAHADALRALCGWLLERRH
ncbi:MAG: farnesyl diphosphate synthase [Pseudomonadota bacterium]|nr:farnesyl diphosphate synthase [Pseudomonadota bacterium]